MHSQNRPVQPIRTSLVALGSALLFAASPMTADAQSTPPILPLQGPLVGGTLAIPFFALGLNVDRPGVYHLYDPNPAATGGSQVHLGVFQTPQPFLIGTVSSAPNRYTRVVASFSYEFAVVPPPELPCEFPHFGIPGPVCLVDVVAIAAGRVQTHGSIFQGGNSFVVDATWSLHDDLGVQVFADGIQIPLTDNGDINNVFSNGQLLSLKANHAYRVTMIINAEAAANSLGASAVALVDPVFSFPPTTDPGYSIRLSDGVGNAVPEPDTFALLAAGLMTIAFRRRPAADHSGGAGSGRRGLIREPRIER